MYHGNSLRFQGSYNYIRFFGCSRPFHSYNWDVRIHMKTHISIWKFTTDKAFRLVLNWCWCLIGSWFRRGNQCFVVTTGYRNIPNTHFQEVSPLTLRQSLGFGGRQPGWLEGLLHHFMSLGWRSRMTGGKPSKSLG